MALVTGRLKNWDWRRLAGWLLGAAVVLIVVFYGGRAIFASARGPVRLVPDIRTRVRVGHPAEEIIREAEEGGYDLVTLGERQNHSFVS